MVASFGDDSAAKWLSPVVLWWFKNGSTWVLAGLMSLKMFRSTSYANYTEEKKKNGTAPPFKPEVKAG